MTRLRRFWVVENKETREPRVGYSRWQAAIAECDDSEVATLYVPHETSLSEYLVKTTLEACRDAMLQNGVPVHYLNNAMGVLFARPGAACTHALSYTSRDEPVECGEPAVPGTTRCAEHS